jgi:site-specific recombinase XerD
MRHHRVASGLKLDELDLQIGTIIVRSGKGAKDRMVYMSTDAHSAVMDYLRVKQTVRTKAIFRCTREPLRAGLSRFVASGKGFNSTPGNQA